MVAGVCLSHSCVLGKEAWVWLPLISYRILFSSAPLDGTRSLHFPLCQQVALLVFSTFLIVFHSHIESCFFY